MTRRRRDRRSPDTGLRGFTLAASVLLGALLLGHSALPAADGWRSIVETMLPWTVALVVVLGVVAALSRSRSAIAGVVVLATIWAILFVPSFTRTTDDRERAVTIASENVHVNNDRLASLIEDLVSRSPDVIALQELDARSRETASASLDAAYPYSFLVGTVGVWSTAPLSNGDRLDLGLGWERALRVDIETSAGPTRLFVVHMASFRPGMSSDRDTMLAQLAATLEADDSPRLAVVGDFNAATTDSELAPVLAQVQEAPGSGLGWGFTWPAVFPLARLDHALVRGLPDARSSVLDENGSDHRGVLLEFDSP